MVPGFGIRDSGFGVEVAVRARRYSRRGANFAVLDKSIIPRSVEPMGFLHALARTRVGLGGTGTVPSDMREQSEERSRRGRGILLGTLAGTILGALVTGPVLVFIPATLPGLITVAFCTSYVTVTLLWSRTRGALVSSLIALVTGVIVAAVIPLQLATLCAVVAAFLAALGGRSARR